MVQCGTTPTHRMKVTKRRIFVFVPELQIASDRKESSSFNSCAFFLQHQIEVLKQRLEIVLVLHFVLEDLQHNVILEALSGCRHYRRGFPRSTRLSRLTAPRRRAFQWRAGKHQARGQIAADGKRGPAEADCIA